MKIEFITAFDSNNECIGFRSLPENYTQEEFNNTVKSIKSAAKKHGLKIVKVTHHEMTNERGHFKRWPNFINYVDL